MINIFNIKDSEFNGIALEIFRKQYASCEVYHKFIDLQGIDVNRIKSIEQIVFLPIEFFRTHKVITGRENEEKIFASSGTTQEKKSLHFVRDVGLYKMSLMKGFENFYGDIKDYCILGLMPSRDENPNSSLIYMVNEFIKESADEDSGFYLNEQKKLVDKINGLRERGRKTILIGLSYALLDFAETYQVPENDKMIVMETGGMKGRRKEMIREELHSILKKAYNKSEIHSEYGMTELLSQSYSKADGVFRSPGWKKILVREMNNPFENNIKAKSGVINVIDLANYNSCSFIATQDSGRMNEDGSFVITGRTDYSDIRGCNLMIDR